MAKGSGHKDRDGHFSAGDTAPHILFARIHDAFQGLGLLDSDLFIEKDGVKYKVSCNDSSFIVYRVTENSGLRHHVPGWPVCLVNSDIAFEECGSSELADDHCTCPMNIETWLDVVRAQLPPRDFGR